MMWCATILVFLSLLSSGHPQNFPPTCQPTTQPSRQPTAQPSSQPTVQPTFQPTSQPSTQPTVQPTFQPTLQPSAQPSFQPTSQPTFQPSMQPSGQPSIQPSSQPTSQPTLQPTLQPTSQPSLQPTTQPTLQPTSQPSRQPTVQPSKQPISKPSGLPTQQPLSHPSSKPSPHPTIRPGSPTPLPTQPIPVSFKTTQEFTGISYNSWSSTSAANVYVQTMQLTVAQAIGSGLQPSNIRITSVAPALASNRRLAEERTESYYYAGSLNFAIIVNYTVTANAGAYTSPSAAFSAYSNALSASVSSNAFAILLYNNAIAKGAIGLIYANPQPVIIKNTYVASPVAAPVSIPVQSHAPSKQPVQASPSASIGNAKLYYAAIILGCFFLLIVCIGLAFGIYKMFSSVFSEGCKLPSLCCALCRFCCGSRCGEDSQYDEEDSNMEDIENPRGDRHKQPQNARPTSSSHIGMPFSIFRRQKDEQPTPDYSDDNFVEIGARSGRTKSVNKGGIPDQSEFDDSFESGREKSPTRTPKAGTATPKKSKKTPRGSGDDTEPDFGDDTAGESGPEWGGANPLKKKTPKKKVVKKNRGDDDDDVQRERL